MSSDIGDLPYPEDMGEQPASVTLVEDRAAHDDGRFNAARSLCCNAVLSQQGIHHLAHYTNGVYDFAVDVLADITCLRDLPAGAIESIRVDCQRIGIQLSNTINDLDETLQEARTGALIRTVLHAPQGVIYCNSVVPNEYVVGLTFDASALPAPDIPLSKLPGAKQTDIAMSRLATDLRKQVSLQSQNPGSWISPKPLGDEVSGGSPGTSATQDIAAHTEGTEDDEVVQLLRAAIDPRNLHYLAFCRDGEVTFSIDHLGHHLLYPYFTQITVEKRRSFYRQLCRRLPVLIGQLGRMVGSAIGGRLDRIILDVEQGAIYFYRLRTGEYLVGATIDQGEVEQTDDKMALLAINCQIRTK